ncbi:MAG: penicillin-binding protein 2 [Fidelibacterota bacterium]
MKRETKNLTSKYRIITIIAVSLLIFAVLIARFFNLQIINYSVYRTEALGNMLNRIDIAAPRGLVYDRNGKKIIYNVPCYNLVVYPHIIKQNPETWKKLETVTGVPVETLMKNMKKNQYGAYRQAVVLHNIDFKTNTGINEDIRNFPGAEVVFSPIREYCDDIKSGNILGYTAQIRRGDIYKYRQRGYKLGDYIGFDGIEKQYEHLLKGERGYRYKQVNAIGKSISDQAYEQINPVPGNALYLTIDLDLQAHAESLLLDHNGAAILMNYENGEIMAAVSSPSYDPDIFTEGLTQTEWDSIMQDKRIPLFNRLIRGQYPAGSVYKMIAAIAALEKNVITPSTEYECTGSYRLGNRDYKCTHAHGVEDLNEAIAHSCNVYFYHIILDLGIDVWSDYAKKMGFGQATGIDLPKELAGLSPDREFLDERYGKRKWWKGMWLNMVIGQGDVLVTPMQIISYTATLATHGKIVTPHFLRSVHYTDERSEETVEYPVKHISDISEKTWKEIESGMRNAVQSSRGTGRTGNVSGLDMCGKTGTAQNPHGQEHSWFLGYSRKKGFPYAVVAFVEQGGTGSETAAPIAGQLLKAYYHMR